MRITAPAFVFSTAMTAFGQSPLPIPDTLAGPVYNLSAQESSLVFFPGYNTPTMGYNGAILGPTLIMNQGDSITINVTNNMSEATTVHWHGIHVPARYDGGPHQVINPTETWSPTFRVLNRASTFWYHPHGNGQTERQVARGLAGFIIIRDNEEAAYELPRTYGVDDFPLVVQSKAFDLLYQFSVATHEDSIMLVNGVRDPYLEVPAQVVRLRLLNGSVDRTFNFGLSDNSSFHVISSDGGLLAAPVQVNRLRLSNGERAEVLIDFANYSVGDSLYLMSYADELPNGIIGADSVGMGPIQISEGYYGNALNGVAFNVLRFNVADSTANPVRSIPTAFAPVPDFDEDSVSATRSLLFEGDFSVGGMQSQVDGPFLINDEAFHMDSINEVVQLDATEIWILSNQTMVAHPFHIHDIQFRILDINSNPPPPLMDGLKDVVLVEPGDVVRFITQFPTYADNHVPYMYHCHMLHHEDDGMMGAFLVFDSTMTSTGDMSRKEIMVYPNPTMDAVLVATAINPDWEFAVVDLAGRTILSGILTANSRTIDLTSLHPGLYSLTLVAPDISWSVKVIRL